MSGGLQNPLPEGADDAFRHKRHPEKKGRWAWLGDALGPMVGVVVATLLVQLLLTGAPGNTPIFVNKAEAIVEDLPSHGGGLSGAAAEVQLILENDRDSDGLAAAWNGYTQSQSVYDGDLESLAGIVDQLPIAAGRRTGADLFWLRDSIRNLKAASQGLYDCLDVEQRRLWQQRLAAARADAYATQSSPSQPAGADTGGTTATAPAGDPVRAKVAVPALRLPEHVKVVCKRPDGSAYFYESQLKVRQACSATMTQSLPGLLRFLKEEGNASALDKIRLGSRRLWGWATDSLKGVHHSPSETEAQYWVRLRGDLSMVCGNVLEPPAIRVAPKPPTRTTKPVVATPATTPASAPAPALPQPAAAPPATTKVPVVTEAKALSWPSPAQIAATYPSRGRRAKVEANVRMRCLADVDGALKRCATTAIPTGYGFEEAAKKLAKYYVIQPKTVDGRPEAVYVDAIIPYRLDESE